MVNLAPTRQTRQTDGIGCSSERLAMKDWRQVRLTSEKRMDMKVHARLVRNKQMMLIMRSCGTVRHRKRVFESENTAHYRAHPTRDKRMESDIFLTGGSLLTALCRK